MKGFTVSIVIVLATLELSAALPKSSPNHQVSKRAITITCPSGIGYDIGFPCSHDDDCCDDLICFYHSDLFIRRCCDTDDYYAKDWNCYLRYF